MTQQLSVFLRRPNPRLQRTPSAPLSRNPLGALAPSEWGALGDRAPYTFQGGLHSFVREPRRCSLEWLLLAVVVYLLLPSDVLHGGSTLQRKEQALRDDLLSLRECVSQFRSDRGRYPESLDQLVSTGYIRKVPTDPFTRSNATWQVDRDEIGGIRQVRSGSNAVSSLKSRYSEW